MSQEKAELKPKEGLRLELERLHKKEDDADSLLDVVFREYCYHRLRADELRCELRRHGLVVASGMAGPTLRESETIPTTR